MISKKLIIQFLAIALITLSQDTYPMKQRPQKPSTGFAVKVSKSAPTEKELPNKETVLATKTKRIIKENKEEQEPIQETLSQQKPALVSQAKRAAAEGRRGKLSSQPVYQDPQGILHSAPLIGSGRQQKIKKSSSPLKK